VAPPINPEDEPEGWRETLAQWGPAVLAVIFIRLFLFEPFRIPSGSMVPTLLIGDHVLVTKFSYGVWLPFKSLGVPFSPWGLDDLGLKMDNVELVDLADPQRGDVIVFHYPLDEDVTYIKRVIGVPGDTLRIENNQVVLNGELQAVDFVGEFADIDQACHPRQARFGVEPLAQTDGGLLEHGVLTNRGFGGPLSNRAEIKIPPETVFVMGDNRDHSEDSRRWGLVRYEQIKGKAHFVWLSWDGCSGAQLGGPRLDRMFSSLYASEGLRAQAIPVPPPPPTPPPPPPAPPVEPVEPVAPTAPPSP
jgi:signal peptidase I